MPDRWEAAPVADQTLVLAALTDFARTLVQRYAIADVLTELTEQCVPALTLAGAGVSVGDEDGVLRFVTATQDALLDVERTQEAAQEGPCADCFRGCAHVTASNLAAEERWPVYRPVALRGGFRAAAALPLRAADGCIGSLNLYDTSVREWSDADIGVAGLFADMAASYLANASDFQRSERIREQLQKALDSGIIIEQAKGVIAGQHGIPVDDAYRRLRSYTRGHNARLHDVAHAVVHLGLTVA
jgi:GAF domain-containing protein